MKFYTFNFVACTFSFFICTIAKDHNIPSIEISCTHDDHCGDFRMICSEEEICVCSRFYDWDEELKQCHLNLSEIGLWLDSMKEERDLRAELDAEANAVFSHLAFAGLSAIFLGLFGVMACVYCFCFKKPTAELGDESFASPLVLTEGEKKNIASGDAGLTNILFINP